MFTTGLPGSPWPKVGDLKTGQHSPAAGDKPGSSETPSRPVLSSARCASASTRTCVRDLRGMPFCMACRRSTRQKPSASGRISLNRRWRRRRRAACGPHPYHLIRIRPIRATATAELGKPPVRHDDHEDFVYREGLMHLCDKNPSPGIYPSRSWDWAAAGPRRWRLARLMWLEILSSRVIGRHAGREHPSARIGDYARRPRECAARVAKRSGGYRRGPELRRTV
jgi:hypothetical protein